MDARVSRASETAIAPSGTSVGKSVVDENWFADMCRALFNGKAGTALHFITGFDERSCQRYAAGQVKPPAYFLRALLRSEQGWVFLNALMAGSSAQWWRDFELARDIIEKRNSARHFKGSHPQW
jgi:hypothetical protein